MRDRRRHCRHGRLVGRRHDIVVRDSVGVGDGGCHRIRRRLASARSAASASSGWPDPSSAKTLGAPVNGARLVIELDELPRGDVVPRSGGVAVPDGDTTERRRRAASAWPSPRRPRVAAAGVAPCPLPVASGCPSSTALVDGVAGALARAHDAQCTRAAPAEPGQSTRRHVAIRSPPVGPGGGDRIADPHRHHHVATDPSASATTVRPVARRQSAPRRPALPRHPASAAASAAARARPASTTSPRQRTHGRDQHGGDRHQRRGEWHRLTLVVVPSPSAPPAPSVRTLPSPPPSQAAPSTRAAPGRRTLRRSSLARIGATEATVWPSSRFITRTPVAPRPCEEISRTGMRIVTPLDDTATISSSRPTMNAATTSPLRPVSLMPMHTLAAAALRVVLVELRALAVPGLGDHQDRRVVAGDVDATRPRRRCRSFMPRTPAARATHRAHVVLVEADRHALAADHEDVVAAAGLDDLDQLVAVVQVDGDEAVAAARVVGVERRLLDRALLVAKNRKRSPAKSRVSMIAWIFSPGLQRQQVDDRHALGRALALGDLERPQAVDLAAVGEEQQVGVGRREDDVAHDVVGLQLGAADATATAALRLERPGRHRLDVLRLGHHDDELLVVDEVLDRHLAGVVRDLAHARRGELLLDREHLVLDDLAQQTSSARIASSSLMRVAHVGELGLEVDPADSRVSWRSCMSRMSIACSSENSNGSAIRPALAAAASSLARIRAMIASITSSALMRPSRMCSRRRALSRRNSERRVMTSTWWRT